MTIKKKYDRIDQSKLPSNIEKVLKGIKSKTKNFEDDDANEVFESKLDTIIKGLKKKYPEAVGEKGKTSKYKIENALKSINTLISNDPVLKGFRGSDVARDKDRKAKASGKRLSKYGNIYYEYRENRTDRYAPNFPRKGVYLQDGGETQERYIPLFINDYIFNQNGEEKSYSGWGIYDTKKGAFTNLSTDKEMKPYVLSFSTAKEIANWQNIGEIKASAIYTVPHTRHRFNKELKKGALTESIPSLIKSTKHKTEL